mmetsp:Transcript_16864/g.43874  ORF Transcript_16864/g.43874 Transcript_16864/m.43874 type:complete len:183 (-) Transcript_16864:727-1275(-)
MGVQNPPQTPRTGRGVEGSAETFAVVPDRRKTPTPPSPTRTHMPTMALTAGGPRVPTGTCGKRTHRTPTSSSKRRSRKEPVRGEYATDAEYAAAYGAWREFRAKQAESVNRSRAKAKREEYEQDLKIRVTEHENELLERRIAELKANIELYSQVLKQSMDTVDGLDFGDTSLEVLMDEALAP